MLRRNLPFVIAFALMWPVACSTQETDATLANRIDAYLTQSTERGFSGAVLVARRDGIILSRGYGLADRVQGIPIEPSTVFNIGSVTKPFTAAAIMKLVEQGKLKTTDTLATFFPNAPVDKQVITIHQLLTHTAGISERTGGFRYDRATRDQFLDELFETPLVRAPGTQHEYANAGYILLAAIVEIVSGQPFEAFLHGHIFEPAGMRQTGYTIPEWDLRRVAHSYYFDVAQNDWVDWGTTLDRFGDDGVSWYGIGKGDLQSTVEDLYAWHRALEAGTVLSPDTQALMETRHVPEPPRGVTHYGYGWAIFTSEWNTRIVTHNGSNGYFFADFIRHVEDGVVIACLTNLNRDEGVAWNIARMIFEPGFQPPTFPRDDYEVISEFIEDHAPSEADTLLDHFERIQHPPLRDKAVLNRIGVQRMQQKDHQWSIPLFALNVQLFPDDGNLWDSLGEAYLASGKPALAIDSFEEALRLAPETDCFWCENSRARLTALGAGAE